MPENKRAVQALLPDVLSECAASYIFLSSETGGTVLQRVLPHVCSFAVTLHLTLVPKQNIA
eukprot:1150796-Pelagomonas_calceolata.AAC.14